MEGVIGDDHGTAKSARIPGFTIAGKTGTAAKLVNGRYSHSEYNASFVGFIPSRDPAVAVVVVIDSPHGPNRYFGGTVSAPIFKRIAEATLQYLGIPRTIDPDPPVLVARNETQATAGVPTVPEPVVSLVAEGSSSEFPDLRGMSAREAMRRVAKLGLTARITGDGFVVSQEPSPGTPLDAITVCRLTLNRSAARLAAALVSP
jgi:membrane peptidoglycan carboxypeptidase